MSFRIRIAVDAMGGDEPEHSVHGALLALKELPDDCVITLVGEQSFIWRELRKHLHRTDDPRLPIVRTTQVIQSEDHVADARYKKRDSSMMVGIKLVKHQEAQALVSAGNTGVLVGMSQLMIGRLPGVRRAALAATFPTVRGVPCVVLDVGANAECKSEWLAQFGLMGAAYAELVLHQPEPRVGLVNIGTEFTKGNETALGAYDLLCTWGEQGVVNFSGNAEGDTVFSGDYQTLITNGFTGNVVLKLAESLLPTIAKVLRNAIRSGKRPDQKVFAWLSKDILLGPTIGSVKRALDYTRYGGAPLLGIQGVVIKTHGKSVPEAYKHAILNAHRAIGSDMVSIIGQRMAGHANGDLD